MFGVVLGHAPEDSHVTHPYFHNDLGNFEARGGTVTIGGLNHSPSMTNAFKAHGNSASWNNSSYSGSTMTVTLTTLPKNLNYGGYIGISFGNSSWAPASCKIEISTDGGSTWTTRLNDSSSKTIYFTSTGTGGTSLNAIRFTIGQAVVTSSIRVTNIWAYNYNSNGMHNYFIDKAGDTLYGELSFNDADTKLLEGGGNRIKVQTNHGYVEVGAGNAAHAHFITDRPSYYFDKEVKVDTGIIGSYNEDLVLRRAGSTANQITLGTAGVTFATGYTLSMSGTISSTVADKAFWANNASTYVQVGPNGGGAAGTFGAHRLTTNSGLDYTTYIGYDCYYSDTTQKWKALRTSLGRKWKTNFGGYHQNRFTISTYDGGGTSGSSLSAGWLEADWEEKFGVDATGVVDIANSLRIGTTTVIDSSRNLTNIGTISSGAITSSGNMSLTGELAITKSTSLHSLIFGNRDDFADSSSDSLIWITSGNGTFKNGQGAHLVFEGRKDNRSFYFKVGNVTAPQHIMHSNGHVGFGTGDIVPTDRVHVDGTLRADSYKIGVNTVIDSSRNLTNIGTISSGAITATGTSSFGRILSSDRMHVTAGHSTARFQLEYQHSGTDHVNNADVLIWASEPGISYNGGGFGINIHESGQYYGRADDNKSYGVYMRMGPSNGNTEFWTTTGSRGTAAGQGTKHVTIEPDGDLFLHDGDMYLGSTKVFDNATRNLQSIGTISSGNIASGSIAAGGAISSTSVIGNLVTGSQGQQMEKGDDNVTTLRFDANRWRLYAGANAGETITAKENGNVGINQSDPSVKLDVNGDAGFTQKVGIGTTTFTNALNSRALVIGSAFTTSSASLFVDGFSRFKGDLYLSKTSSPGNYFGISYANEKLTLTKAGSALAAIDAPDGYYLGTTQVIDASRNLKNIAKFDTVLVPRTFAIPSTGSNTNQWVYIGRATGLSQSGSSVSVRLRLNNGYNASNAQNMEGYFRFKTSNGGSEQSGFYGDAQLYRFGQNTAALQQLKVVQASTTEYRFYILVTSFTGSNSNYTVEQSSGSWENVGTYSGTAPTGTLITADPARMFVSGFAQNDSLNLGTGSLSSAAITTSGNISLSGDLQIGGTSVIGSGRELQNIVKLKTNDGTATAPSHTFTSDTNTGMFSGGADVLKLTAGGVTGITINSDTVALIRDNVNVKDYLRHYGDTDTHFRFTTDRIRMVAGNVTFMDATEGTTDYLRFPTRAVTIGNNTAPNACLTIEQNSTTTPADGGGSAGEAHLRIDNANTTASASSVIAFNADDAGGNTRHGAGIQFKKASNWGNASNSYPGELYFWTRPSSGNQVAAQKLDKDGNAIFKGNVTAYGSLSDRRLKKNIENITDATVKVQKLNGVTFDYKKDGKRATGLIAQDLKQVLPEAVYTSNDMETGEEHLAIHYGNVVGLLVEAIKELKQEIEDLKNGNNKDD